MRPDVLAAGLDRLYADRTCAIEKFTLMVYSKGTEAELQLQLEQWAAAGHLEILKPVAGCEKMEPCIRLLGWIQPRKPPP